MKIDQVIESFLTGSKLSGSSCKLSKVIKTGEIRQGTRYSLTFKADVIYSYDSLLAVMDRKHNPQQRIFFSRIRKSHTTTCHKNKLRSRANALGIVIL